MRKNSDSRNMNGVVPAFMRASAIFIVMMLVFLGAMSSAARSAEAYVKLEPISNNTIKLTPEDNQYSFEITFDKDSFKTGEEITGWLMFSINGIPVASKDTTIDIIRNDVSIRNLFTAKTYFRTSIDAAGIYTIKAQTNYKDRSVVATKKIIVYSEEVLQNDTSSVPAQNNGSSIGLNVYTGSVKTVRLSQKSFTIDGTIGIAHPENMEVSYPLPLEMFIYGKESENFVRCTKVLDLNGKTGSRVSASGSMTGMNEDLFNFSCSYDGFIEIGQYVIESSLNLGSSQVKAKNTINVSIEKSSSLNLSISVSGNKTYSPMRISVDSTEKNVTIGIKITSPDNSSVYLVKDPKKDSVVFYPRIAGIHKIDAEAIKEGRYTRETASVEIFESNDSFRITPLENMDFRNNNNITFSVRLPKINRSSISNLTITIMPSDTGDTGLESDYASGTNSTSGKNTAGSDMKDVCRYSIMPDETEFNVSCKINGIIVVGEYRFESSLAMDGMTFNLSGYFKFNMQEANITLFSTSLVRNFQNRIALKIGSARSDVKVYGTFRGENESVNVIFQHGTNGTYYANAILNEKDYEFLVTVLEDGNYYTKVFNVNTSKSRRDMMQGIAEIGKPVKWIEIKNTDFGIYLPIEARNVVIKNLKGEIIADSNDLTVSNSDLTLSGLKTEIEELRTAYNKKLAEARDKKESGTRFSLDWLLTQDEVGKKLNKLSFLGINRDSLDTEFDRLRTEIIGVELSESALSQGNQVIIEYDTPGPEQIESGFKDNSNVITIESSYPYKNITTETFIRETPEEKIRLYWYIEGKKTDVTDSAEIALKKLDTNGNGLIDKLEWITPHTSTQIFEVSIVETDKIWIEKSMMLQNKLWLVSTMTNGTEDLNIESTKGLFVSNVTCGYLDQYASSISQESIEQIWQSGSNNTESAGNGFNVQSESSFSDWSCDKNTIITYTVQLPEILNRTSLRMSFGNDTIFASPLNTSLYLSLKYNKTLLNNENVTSLDLKIIPLYNYSEVLLDNLTIVLKGIDGSIETRVIDKINSNYLFTLDKTRNLYSEIEIIGKYNGFTAEKKIIIAPKVTNDIPFGSNIEFFTSDIESARVLDIDRNDAGFSLKIEPSKITAVSESNSIRPGLYQIEIVHPGYTEHVWFRYGLVSINTLKPIYHHNESAEIRMVVLDNSGYIVKDAKITLKITNPDGSLVYHRTDGYIRMNDDGIYETRYYLGETGRYTLEVTAESYDGKSTVTSYVYADDDYAFDIIRSAPMTIDPWKGTFRSSISVKSYENISSFDVIERLPGSFEIINSGGANIDRSGNDIYLTWKNVKDRSNVSYEAQAPKITPYLYELGKIRIDYGGMLGFGKESFYENRSWMFAIDPVSIGNAFLMYSQADVGVPLIYSPRYRIYNPSTNNFGSSLSDIPDAPALTNNHPNWIELARNPKKKEVMVIWETREGGPQGVYAAVWNGSKWKNNLTLTTNSGTPYKAMDVAYETKSGRGMVVYGVSGSNVPRYRIWNGTAWSSEQTANDIGGNVRFMRLISNPLISSNQMILITSDSNSDINVQVWDGSNWGTVTELTASAVADRLCFDAAYESKTGDALVAYKSGTTSDFYYYTYSGGTWTSGGAVALGGQSYVFQLAPDPKTNRIAAAVSRAATGLQLFMWSGTGWTSMGTPTTTLTSVASIPFDLKFESNTGRLFSVYGEGVNVRYVTVNNGSTTLSAESTVGGYSYNIGNLRLTAAQFTNHLYLGTMSVYYDMGFGIWNGTTWTNTGLAVSGPSDTTHQNYRMLANVEYFNIKAPTSTYYGLNITNGAAVTRTARIKAYSRWDDAERGLVIPGYANHNGNGSDKSYNATVAGKWANYTIVLSNITQFNHVGRVDVTNISATDLGVYGVVNDIGWFFIYDHSNVSSSSLSRSIVNESQQFNFSCRVIDKELSKAITDYTVYFYLNSTYLGSKKTNATGWATYTGSISVPGTYRLNCSIGDNGYYYATAGQRYMTRNIAVRDKSAPIVTLISPLTNYQDVDGSVTFFFNASDTYSAIANCSLITNGTIRSTKTTISETSTNNITFVLANGRYEWSINCTDNSLNRNKGASDKRIILIRPDNVAPVITHLEPPNGVDTLSNVIIKYTATDALSDVDRCTLILDGITNATNNTMVNGDIVLASLYGLDTGVHTWRVNCSDDSPLHNWALSNIWTFNVGTDNSPPDITIIKIVNNSVETDNIAEFTFNVSDYMSGITNCSVYINGTLRAINTSVNEAVTQRFSIGGMAQGRYRYFLRCYDNSTNRNYRTTSTRYFTVNYDYEKPYITLISPPNLFQSVSGNMVFTYTVTDENDIANCSLLINNTIRSTQKSVTRNINQNFTLNSMAIGSYNWRVRCYDIADSRNFNTSEIRNFSVGPDTIPPSITLISPSNNSIDTDGNMIFAYIVNDVTSGIDSCTLYINGSNADVDSSISENVVQYLYSSKGNGRYRWYIRCLDDSPAMNARNSATWYFNVSLDFETNLTMSLEDHYVSRGEIITPNATFLDRYRNALGGATVYGYIVRNLGTSNQTMGWKDTSWKRRIEVPVTNNNAQAFQYGIIPITLNTQTLITSGRLKANCSDLRLVDQGNNYLNYYFWNASQGCNNANTRILVKMNNNWRTKTNRIGIYFNNSAANSNTYLVPDNYLVADNFDNGDTFSSGYWSRGTTTPLGSVTVSNANFADGANSARVFVSCTGVACDYALEATSFEKTIIVSSASTLRWRWINPSGTSSLNFYLDGSLISSSTAAWTQSSATISAGTHTVMWELKLTSTGGSDRVAYVDQIYLSTNNMNIGTLTSQSEPVSVLGSNTTQSNGKTSFNWRSAGFAYGNYSVTGYGTQTNYWSDYSGYNFRLGPDIEKPVNQNWGLNISDGDIIVRRGSVKAYSYWYDKVNVSGGRIEHRGTGANVNYTITPVIRSRYAYANYTLNTSKAAEFNHLGRVDVNAIYANDSSNNWGKATPAHYFTLYSTAEMFAASLNRTSLGENGLFAMTCRVRDEFNSATIQNYPVSFYYNGNYVGRALTNSTGWARLAMTAVTPGINVPVICNITTNSSLYYFPGTPNYMTRYINVTDMIPPNVTLFVPQNRTRKSTPIISLGFFAKDSGLLDKCLLYGNWRGGWHLNQTKGSITNGGYPYVNYFAPIQFPQGQFWWYVRCNDSAGNMGTSRLFTFNVSLSEPVVTLYTPADYGKLGAGRIMFNFSVDQIDVDVGITACRLYMNNTLNQTKPGIIPKNVPQQFYINNLRAGRYNWTVTCDANNTLSHSRSRVLEILELQIQSPVNNTRVDRDSILPATADSITLLTREIRHTPNINITFIANITNPNLASMKNVILGWNRTNASGYAVLNFNPNRYLLAGNYSWWTRFSNWTYSKSGKLIFINLGGVNMRYNSTTLNPNANYRFKQNITINTDVSPIGNETRLQLSANYNINVTAIFKSPSGTKNRNFTLAYNSNTWRRILNSTNFPDHGYWNVSIYMNSTRKFIFSNSTQWRLMFINMTGFGIPRVNPIVPTHLKALNSTIVNFSWRPTDQYESSIKCNLTIDGMLNRSNIIIANNTRYDALVSGFSQGTHTWNVTCMDKAYNRNTSNTWTFYVDTIKPKIKFVAPTLATNTVVSRNWTYVNVTVNDTTRRNVTLQWSGVNQSMICTGVSPNYVCRVNRTNLADGNYSYRAYVNDSVNNRNSTEMRYVGIDTKAPRVNFVNPTLANGTTTPRTWIYVNASVIEPYLSRAIMEWNSVNYTMTCLGTVPNRYCRMNMTGLSNGMYRFRIYTNDTMGHRNQTVYRTLYVDNTPPKIQFVNPTYPTNTVIPRNWTYINVTVNETTLRNVTLQWIATNMSMTCSGTAPNYVCRLNRTNLADGNYSYIAYANDSLGNRNRTERRYIGIDTKAPRVNFANPTLANGSTTPRTWIYVNASVIEPYLYGARLEWNSVNYSMTCLGTAPNRYCRLNMTGLSNGMYRFRIYTNDTMGHRNQTVYRTLYVDNTAPKIQFVNPTYPTNTVIPRNWTYINVTVNETTLRNVTLQWIATNMSMSCSGTAPNYVCRLNRTNLADGNYSYIAYANDSIGNKNRTERRYIGIDTKAPRVNFASPTLANGTYTNRKWIFVNISVTEPYLYEARLEWNGVNQSLSCFGTAPNRYCRVNMTGLSDGTYRFKAYVNDTMHHRNQTVYRTIFVDSTAPKIQFVNPTYPTNTIIGRSWTYINVTVNDTHIRNVTLQWATTNMTMVCSGTAPNYVCRLNRTGIADGNYSYIAYANDTLGNRNRTERRYIAIDTRAPRVNFTNPTLANGTTTSRTWIYVNVSVIEPYPSRSILEWNGVNQTLNCFGSVPGKYCRVNMTGLVNGMYRFKVYSNDSLNHRNATAYRTIFVDNTPPKIQFVNPTYPTNTVIPRNWTYINVTVNETTLRNVTLQWVATNQSMICSGTAPNYVCRLNRTNLADGNYSYIAYANDSLGNRNRTERRYIGIDTKAPRVSFANPTLANRSNTSRSWIYVNVSVTEPYLYGARLEWNSVNYSMTCLGTAPNRYCRLNMTGLTDGTYTFRVFVNDTMGHRNQTVYRSIGVDRTAPRIQFVNPTYPTNTVIPRNWTYINVTVNDTHIRNVTLQWIATNQSMACSGTAPNYVCRVNRTNLADGNYSYIAYANDSLGNRNRTERRYIAIDTRAPRINFTNPTLANGSSTTRSWIYVNASVIEPYLYGARLEWNSVNYSMTCLGTAPNRYCRLNMTGITDGIYRFRIFANDTKGHRNVTIFRTIFVDNVAPKIKFVNPTYPTNTVIPRNWTYINVTVNETTLRNVTLQWIATNQSMICSGTAPNHVCYVNRTNLADGNYSYISYANDSLGNRNRTERRYIAIDTRAPRVNYVNPTPANLSVTRRNWMYINVTVTEPYLSRSILQWNSVNYTMTCLGTAPNRYCRMNMTGLADGTYTFKVFVNDTMGHRNSTSYRTALVDRTAPRIQFVPITPVTNTVLGRTWVYVNVTANDTRFANATLAWAGVNQSMSCSGTNPNRVCYANRTGLTDGNYSYIAYANDTLGNLNRTERRYVVVDLTAPTVSFVNPTLANGSSTTRSWIYVNVSVVEPHISRGIIEWNSVNYSMTCLGSASNRYCRINMTGLANGIFRFKVYVNDTVGHVNSTGYRTLFVDSVPPKIRFISPTYPTNTLIARTWSYINVTVNETTLRNVTLQWVMTNQSLSCTGTNPSYVCGVNRTGLSDGNYSYIAYANDSLGNRNRTERRYLVVDLTAPRINFTNPTPANNAVRQKNWTYFNVSVNELHFNRTIFNLNGTNYTMTCSGTVPNYMCRINRTNLVDGNYSYYACSYDKLQNRNCTSVRYVKIMRKFYVQNLGPSLRAVLTNNLSADVSVVPQLGNRNITIITPAGRRIANFSVNFYQNYNWSNITGGTNATTGKSFIHFASGHPEISNRKTLLIPVVINLGAVYVCPGALSLSDVNRSCTGLYYRWGLQNISGYYMLNITGTGGSEGTRANLTIWDDTNDVQGENIPHYMNQRIDFYANFSNKSRYPITNLNGVNCGIRFNISGSWTASASMTYNSTRRLWNYFRSFTVPGNFRYNITCNGTRQAYDVVRATDRFNVTMSVINISNVNANPQYAPRNTNINLSANVTSALGISQVWVNVTGPSGNSFTRMTKSGNRYYYVYTNTPVFGTYRYQIWANDSYGNSRRTSDYTFRIEGTNLSMLVFTRNNTYGMNSLVYLKNESSLTDWWSYSWNYRKPIRLSETRGITRINEPIEVNLTGLSLANNCSEIRIVSKWNRTMPIEVPYQLVSYGSNWCKVVFLANITASASSEEKVHVYYGNAAAPNPSYSDNVQLSAFGGEAYHQIEAKSYRVQLNNYELPQTFISKAGTYQQNFIMGWGGCNGAGMVTDTSSSWRDECDDQGTVTLIEDGPVRSIVRITKTNTVSMDAINKTYTFYPDYFKINITLVGGGTGNYNNNEVSFIRMNHNGNAGMPFRSFNFTTSTGRDPDGFDCAGGHEFIGGWSSNWASIYRSGYDASYSYQVMADPNSAINSFEYYEGAGECGASSRQDIDIDNNEVSGPVTLAFVPHGQQTSRTFGQTDSDKLRYPVSVSLGTQQNRDYTYSNLINQGHLPSSGYVIMTVEYFNTSTSSWRHITTIVNDSATSTLRPLPAGSMLNIGNLWNANPWNTMISKIGKYRAYGRFLNASTGLTMTNEDGTLVTGYYNFTVNYNRSSINASSITRVNINLGQNTTLACQVINPDLLFSYNNYNVSFYRNGTYIGYNRTNAAGFARYSWTPGSVGRYNFSCVIRNDTARHITAIPPTSKWVTIRVWPSGADTTPPRITAVSDTPDPANVTDTIRIRANVTDNKRVSLVRLFVRKPGNDTWLSYNMSPRIVNGVGNGTYEYNFTATSIGGTYNYYIYAEDNWTEPNYATSSHYTFDIIEVKGIAKIKTDKTSYRQFENVYLRKYNRTVTADAETGSRSSSIKYVFFRNGFEDSSGTGSGGFNASVWSTSSTAVTVVNGAAVYSGTYSGHLASNTVSEWLATRTGLINLTGQNDCNITIARRVTGMSTVDDWATLDVYDGTWNNGLDAWGQNNVAENWRRQSYSLNSYNLNSNFRMRMSLTATAGGARHSYLDNVTVTCNNVDLSNNYTDYNLGGTNIQGLAFSRVLLQVDSFDSRGSGLVTTPPDLQVGIWDGTKYDYNYYCGLYKAYGKNVVSSTRRNCTISISDPDTIEAWKNASNRRIRVRPTFLDATSRGIDSIRWSGAWGEMLTPSIVSNVGLNNITGRVLLQVFNNDTGSLVQTLHNQSYVLRPNQIVNISTIWNATPFNTYVRNIGRYYAYVALTTMSGQVIQNTDGSSVSDRYYFDIAYLYVNVTTPLNRTTIYTSNLTINATVNTRYVGTNGWCGYSIDGAANQTMTRIGATNNFTAFANPVSAGNHTLVVYCTDTTGYASRSGRQWFYVDKKTTSAFSQTSSIIDRDSVRPSIPDSSQLVVQVGDGFPGTNVSFYIWLKDPVITGKNIARYIGRNVTNATGYARLNFNPNSTVFAGNYTWYGIIPNGTNKRNMSLVVYGGLNISYTRAANDPNRGYLRNQRVYMNVTLKSSGIENLTILRSIYNMTGRYNLSPPTQPKIYGNLTRAGSYHNASYQTTFGSEIGIWRARVNASARYFFNDTEYRNFSLRNNVAIRGWLSYRQVSNELRFNLTVKNSLNTSINASAFVYVPRVFSLNWMNYTSSAMNLPAGTYLGEVRRVDLRIGPFQNRTIRYNLTMLYNETPARGNLQEALMFGLDPR